ncbi:DNA alkylation repair protein [Alteribacter natronophilus]|uniref:DNA alkylation repair protein n=1 Tax=Alteribacter natronophilus TaxID=2583810 RepID=UPI00110EDF4C|nr:DNA alkylation repair protein [Alteribacter natronophilus]TMW73486.1 DNA alkylation repair protein [Alteribacter natronophilus]
MNQTYMCPSCRAKTRFNVIEQVVTPVMWNSNEGEYEAAEETAPFHLAYNGPDKRVQCGSCGLVEDEIRFIKMAENAGR